MPSTYTHVPNLFLQSDCEDSNVSQRFGLKPSMTWIALLANLSSHPELKSNTKLFFLARHGEGWHNVAEDKYGTEAWDSKWSLRNGDEEMQWGPDPELTSRGIQQAAEMNGTWRAELANGTPLPQTFYCSPLSRALQTFEVTWNGIQPGAIICEDIRELINRHTCDQRRTQSFLRSSHPAHQWHITEDDLLWSATRGESLTQVEGRIRTFLDLAFATGACVVSVTSHSGFIGELLDYIGHPAYTLATGKMIPVVITSRYDP